MSRGWTRAVIVSVAALALAPAGALAAGTAPGAPGAAPLWTAGNKDGFGTATTVTSKVWHTLGDGEVDEVYYPTLGTPAVRDLQFVVTDGRTWVDREREDTQHAISLTDPRSLSYRQVNTDPDGRYRITKTYAADPLRSTLLLRVHFESLTRTPLRLYALDDPALSANGDDDSGGTAGATLVAADGKAASALAASPAFTNTSSGYLGTSDGWTDLHSDWAMDWSYDSAPTGNIVQTGRLELSGKAGSQDATLALGFGASASAQAAANASLAAGNDATARAYQAGWHAYLGGLVRPRSVAGHEQLYDVSLMVLAASEDKTRTAAPGSRPRPWPGYGADPWLQRPVPPRVVARPLPGGERPDRRGRPRLGRPRPRAPVDPPAAP